MSIYEIFKVCTGIEVSSFGFWDSWCFLGSLLFFLRSTELQGILWTPWTPISSRLTLLISTPSTLPSESFSRTLSAVLLLKTISSCLADMALSESMIMFHGWPHIVLFHNSPRNMITTWLLHLSRISCTDSTDCRLPPCYALKINLAKLRAAKSQTLPNFFVLFTDSSLSFSAFFNDVVPISSGGKALILASNVNLALKLRDEGEERRIYQRQWSTTVVCLSK